MRMIDVYFILALIKKDFVNQSNYNFIGIGLDQPIRGSLTPPSSFLLLNKKKDKNYLDS